MLRHLRGGHLIDHVLCRGEQRRSAGCADAAQDEGASCPAEGDEAYRAKASGKGLISQVQV